MLWWKWVKATWNNWNDWRVLYSTGERTYRLRRSEARSLASLFDGVVIFDPL